MTPFASLVSDWKLLAMVPAPEIVLSTLSSDASLSMKIELLAESDSVMMPPPVSATGLGVVCRPMVSWVTSPVPFNAIVPALSMAPMIVKREPSARANVPPDVSSVPSCPPSVPTVSEPPLMASVTLASPLIPSTLSVPL